MPAPAPKPPPPDTVRNAFYLMLAGAVLQAIGIVAALAQIATIRDAIRERMREQPSVSGVDVDSLVNITIGTIVVAGLIGVGLWIWMAFANKAGKNWARITATVFFGISTVSLLSGLAVQASGSTMSVGSSGTALGTILNVLTWLVGLAAIILLWRGRSGQYFRPPSHGYQPPGATWGYPPTGPGQTPGPGAFPPGPAQGAPPGSMPPDGPQQPPPPR